MMRIGPLKFTPQGFLLTLGDIVSVTPITEHPFYRDLWTKGLLGQVTLDAYIRQASFYELSVIEGLQILLENFPAHATLAREHLTEELKHPTLYNRHAREFGIEDASLFDLDRLGLFSQQSVRLMHSFKKDVHPYRIFAALYALEGNICKSSEEKAQSLWTFYSRFSKGDKTPALQYYLTHAEVDKKHRDVWWNLLLDCPSQYYAEVVIAAQAINQALMNFLDFMEAVFWKNVGAPQKTPSFHPAYSTAVGM